MCVGFCRWADLCISHASSGRPPRKAMFGVPLSVHSTLPHCIWVYACIWFMCQWITAECSFVFMKQGKKGRSNIRSWPQSWPSCWKCPFCTDKSNLCYCLFLHVWMSNLQLACVCVYSRLRSSGPFNLLTPIEAYLKEESQSKCCITVWRLPSTRGL